MKTQIVTVDQVSHGHYITSIEIAELVGKPHNDVLKAIRKMEPAWVQEHQGNFSQMQIREDLPNGGYRCRPCYQLTKAESLFIATKFNDVARARLILRWEELERANRQKGSEGQKLLVTEREILLRSDEILRKEISDKNEDARNCFTFSDIAAYLEVERTWMVKTLISRGVIRRVDGRYVLQEPYNMYDYVRYRHHQHYSLTGERKENEYLVWTREGRDFVINFFTGNE